MPDLEKYPVPAPMMWLSVAAFPAIAMLSASYGDPLTTMLVLYLSASFVCAIYAVLHFDTVTSSCVPSIVRVTCGITGVAGCLMHDGWLGVVMAGAAMFDLMVSEVLE